MLFVRAEQRFAALRFDHICAHGAVCVWLRLRVTDANVVPTKYVCVKYALYDDLEHCRRRPSFVVRSIVWIIYGQHRNVHTAKHILQVLFLNLQRSHTERIVFALCTFSPCYI